MLIEFNQNFEKEPAGLEQLVNVCRQLENANVSFSFIVTKTDGTPLFSYNRDWVTTSQSTIKAPFVCSLIDIHPELFEENRDKIKNIITVSSNEDYEFLREKYGTDCLKAWMDRAGIPEKILKWVYPRNITCEYLAKFWPLMYDYLETRAPEDVKTWFYGTMYSAIYSALGKKYKTYTKAGWENGIGDGNDITDEVPAPCYTDGDPENDETATNDSGLVYTENGTYIVVIFTNIPTNPKRLETLALAIDGVAKGFGLK